MTNVDKIERRSNLRCIFDAMQVGLIPAGDEAQVAANWINKMHGAGTISKANCAVWFARFRSGDRSLEDHPRSGAPSAFDEERLRQLIEEDNELTSIELANVFKCDPSTVLRHLHAIGKVWKLGQWVPHKLTEPNKRLRADSAKRLLEMHRAGQLPFDDIVAQDESYILYENVERHGQWVDRGTVPHRTAKAVHPTKVLLSIFWTTRGVVYWELLKKKENMNSAILCAELEQVAHTLRHGPQHQKHAYKKDFFLLFDNAGCHRSGQTQNKLLELGFKWLHIPANSPDISPCDYYLFRSLKNKLRGKVFKSEADVGVFLDAFFASKSPEFWRDGMEELAGRWEEVLATEGEYVSD